MSSYLQRLASTQPGMSRLKFLGNERSQKEWHGAQGLGHVAAVRGRRGPHPARAPQAHPRVRPHERRRGAGRHHLASVLMDVQLTPGAWLVAKTLEGSFSSVSKLIFANQGSFCGIF